MKRLSLLLAGLVAIGYGSSVWAANAYTQGAVRPAPERPPNPDRSSGPDRPHN